MSARHPDRAAVEPRKRKLRGMMPMTLGAGAIVVLCVFALQSGVAAVQLARLALDALALLCGACAIFGIAYTGLAGWLIGRFFARAKREPSSFPSVTIIKPLNGDEWNLTNNLVSFFEQDYPGPVQFLFGVHASGDAALTIIQEMQKRYPHAHITVVVDSQLHGPNRKISNLVNMLPQAQYDVLCFADSDVSVGPHYLRHLMGELERPEVGLVTCAYRGLREPGFWPRFSAAATNYQFLPGVVVGLALGLAQPCFGQTIVMRRETLEQIGGLSQFAHHLAEDHALGKAVRALGAKVAIPSFTVSHACVESSFAKLISHELRWSRTIRAVDRTGHAGSALMHPLAFAVLAVLFSAGASWSWPLVMLALIARAILKWRTDRAVQQACGGLWLLPMWDLLTFVVFVASFFSTRVVWRGFDFHVDADGLLYPLQDE